MATALRSHLLLSHLRNHDHRHPEVQALHHAVHAAVGHKDARPLEQLQLRDERREQEIRWGGIKRSNIDAFSMGQHRLPGLLAKGLKAEIVEIWSVVRSGAQRNEEGWPAFQALEGKAGASVRGMMEGPTKTYRSSKVTPAG